MSLNTDIKSVKELTNEIKNHLETAFPYVWVKGELGAVKLHSSGHRYFSLKEDDCVINGICWRGTPLSVELEEGKMVECYAKVTIFGGRSSYQIVAKEIRELAFKGDIFLNLEKLKKQLISEKIFDLKQAAELPKFAKRIGILTSPTGAVFHDMMHRINDRFPCVDVWFLPINVQGSDSKKSILDGLSRMDEVDVDIVILARGGGSLEDLWIFNDEDVVRKVAGLKKPIITAIGHETDTTLVDYAASLRAPTPTAAIELCLPDKDDLRKELKTLVNVVNGFVVEKVANMTRQLIQFEDVDRVIENVIESFYQKIDNFMLIFNDNLKEKLQKNALFLAAIDSDFIYSYIDKVQSSLKSVSSFAIECVRLRVSQAIDFIGKNIAEIEVLQQSLKNKVFVVSSDQQVLTTAASIKKLNKAPFQLVFYDDSITVKEQDVEKKTV